MPIQGGPISEDWNSYRGLPEEANPPCRNEAGNQGPLSGDRMPIKVWVSVVGRAGPKSKDKEDSGPGWTRPCKWEIPGVRDWGRGLEEPPLEYCPPSKSLKWQVPEGTVGLRKRSWEAAESFQTHKGEGLR